MLNALTEFNGSNYVDWCKELPLVCSNYFRPLLGGDIPLKLPPKGLVVEIPAK